MTARNLGIARSLLIYNQSSGSHLSGLHDVLKAELAGSGTEVVRDVDCSGENLPELDDIMRAEIDLVVVHAGDGTINNLAHHLSGWSGSILVLPGGTLNLLSRKIHGGISTSQIIGLLGAGKLEPRRLPAVAAGERLAFAGLIAGATTQWATVRENLRQRDIGSMVQSVPEAWSSTLNGDKVRIQGQEREYPAIFVEPMYDDLRLVGFCVESMAEMVKHGLAWLNGDFRTGPHDDLGNTRTVTLVGLAERVGVEFDGEAAEVALPLACRLTHSSVDFLVNTVRQA